MACEKKHLTSLYLLRKTCQKKAASLAGLAENGKGDAGRKKEKPYGAFHAGVGFVKCGLTGSRGADCLSAVSFFKRFAATKFVGPFTTQKLYTDEMAFGMHELLSRFHFLLPASTYLPV